MAALRSNGFDEKLYRPLGRMAPFVEYANLIADDDKVGVTLYGKDDDYPVKVWRPYLRREWRTSPPRDSR